MSKQIATGSTSFPINVSYRLVESNREPPRSSSRDTLLFTTTHARAVTRDRSRVESVVAI